MKEGNLAQMAERRVQMPESPTEVPPGFLAEIWQNKEPLPTLSAREELTSALQRGVQTIFALPMSNTVTILTVALSLFLFAGFQLLLSNGEHILSGAGNTLYITAYVKDGGNIAATSLMERLGENPHVGSAKFTTKERALEQFRKELGARSSFLDGLEGDNPLPASVDLVLQPGTNENDRTAILELLRSDPSIEEVVYGSEWFSRVEGVLRLFRWFGGALSLLVLGIVVFLISNTIRLVIYSRRDEIHIMQLVGATDGFIRAPFLVGGALQGATGAILGVSLLFISFLLVKQQAAAATLFGMVLPNIVFLSPLSVIVMVVGGALVGAAASYVALGRHLDV